MNQLTRLNLLVSDIRFELEKAMVPLGYLGEIRLHSYHLSLEDSTDKAVIFNRRGKKAAFLSFSDNAVSNLTSKELRISRKIRNELDGPIADHILTPILDGCCNNIHYIVWPYGKPLSSRGIGKRVQMKFLKTPVISWLFDLMKVSLREVDRNDFPERFQKPLLALVSNRKIRKEVKAEIIKALGFLESGKWRPYYSIAHNDLWAGNFLIMKNKIKNFAVIDWAGAEVESYPILDFLCVAKMFRLPRRELLRELNRFCRYINIPVEYSMCYMLAGMAYIGSDLNKFPEDQYIDALDWLFDYLAGALAK